MVAEFKPGKGNLKTAHPEPKLIEPTPDARVRLGEIPRWPMLHTRRPRPSRIKRDGCGPASNEKARRLAPCMRAQHWHRNPDLRRRGELAWSLVEHPDPPHALQNQPARAAGDFESQCKAMIRVLREWAVKHPPIRGCPSGNWSGVRAWSPCEHDEVR